jgi:hypothetical protein
MGRPRKLRFPVGLFIWLKLSSKALVRKGGIGMNSTTYMIAGVLLIIVGVVGIYYIRDAPGLAFFASMGLLGGIAMIAKATGKL